MTTLMDWCGGVGVVVTLGALVGTAGILVHIL